MAKPATQLDLSMPLHKVATLHEQLDVCKRAYTDAHTQCQQLDAALQAERARNAQLQRERATLQRQLALLEHQNDMYIEALHVKACQAPPDQGLVRDILKLAHPDRWSQGQDAAQLAHEILVRLNGWQEVH